MNAGEHAARVDAWLERSAKGLSSEALLRLFEAAFGALWLRTKTTLGEVTLTAIAERVLYNASEKFPLLATIEVEPMAGIQCRALREQIGTVRDSELMKGIRFVLVEFLTVLGNLTAEILTPELHAELLGVALPAAGRREKAAKFSSPLARARKES
jgi:hypothetical protein